MNKDEFSKFLVKYADKWRWARTYERFAPHEYLLMKDVNQEDRHLFPEIAKLIREKGKPRKFFKKTFYYLKVDGYKYWTMDWPLERTDLINRAKVDGYPDIDQAKG